MVLQMFTVVPVVMVATLFPVLTPFVVVTVVISGDDCNADHGCNMSMVIGLS